MGQGLEYFFFKQNNPNEEDENLPYFEIDKSYIYALINYADDLDSSKAKKLSDVLFTVRSYNYINGLPEPTGINRETEVYGNSILYQEVITFLETVVKPALASETKKDIVVEKFGDLSDVKAGIDLYNANLDITKEWIYTLDDYFDYTPHYMSWVADEFINLFQTSINNNIKLHVGY